MSRALVRTHHQITIPEEIRKQVPIEVGDPVEISLSKNGEIVIKPLKAVDPAQSWFWTKEWQEKEREADLAIARGEVSAPFSSAKELIKHLRKKKNR